MNKIDEIALRVVSVAHRSPGASAFATLANRLDRVENRSMLADARPSIAAC